MSDASPDPRAALDAYDLAPVECIVPAGGTAGRTWKVTAGGKDYFLRMRGVRTAAEARLRFDHGLRQHLTVCGVPTVAALRTREGGLWVRLEGRAFELYPFVEGRAFRPENEREIASAASALARYHRAAASYRPPTSEKEPIAQYTTLGFFDDVSDRMDDPGLLVKTMQEVRKLGPAPQDRQAVDRCIARAESMRDTYAGPAYDRLAGWVIHGDYTPANLLFSESGHVVGIFDLDWAVPGARCRDVADGLYFFATVPRRVDPASIWSLTEAADFDPDRCAVFLSAYHRMAPLAPHELEAVPQAFAGRWLSIHLEGMAKVRPEERFRFFSRDIEKPLHWLDGHWTPLKNRIG